VLEIDGRTKRRGVADRSGIAERIRTGTMSLRDEVTALERVALEEALRSAGGNAARAARLLGAVGRGRSQDPGATVRAMIRRLGADGEKGRKGGNREKGRKG
jgi:transcriptional regulator with GAF, ATPase, and Fis domain